MSPGRTVGVAGLGVLLAVLAWAGWGFATSDGSSEAAAPPVAVAPPVDDGRARHLPTPSRVPAQPEPGSDAGRVAAAPVPRAPAIVPDGFERRQGMLVAVRSSARTEASPSAAPPVALPSGVRPEDAVVSPAGIVTVMRSDAAAGSDANAADAVRPVTATHAP